MTIPTCHPERIHKAKGLCSQCYHKQPRILEKAREVSRKHYLTNRNEYLERSRKTYRASPDKRREYTQRWRENNPAKVMLKSAMERAKKKGIEFNIDLSDISIPDQCPVLGFPIRQESGRWRDHSPSLDRIDNTKGYVKGNIIVVSDRANRLKGDGTPEELRRIADFYSSLQSTSTDGSNR